MKLRRILAAIAASAVATSAMAISTFAAIDTNIDLLAAGYDVTEIYGVTVILDGDVDAGVGGGIGFNSASTEWESHEWGNAAAGKELTASSDGVLTLMKDAPVFLESDATDPENPYAQVWVQSWWGEIALSEVILLDADGNAIVLEDGAADEGTDESTDEAGDIVDDGAADDGAADDGAADDGAADDGAADDGAADDGAADDGAADDGAADDGAVDTDTDTGAEGDKGSADTGVEGIAAVAGVVALAGAAVVASRKRK